MADRRAFGGGAPADSQRGRACNVRDCGRTRIRKTASGWDLAGGMGFVVMMQLGAFAALGLIERYDPVALSNDPPAPTAELLNAMADAFLGEEGIYCASGILKGESAHTAQEVPCHGSETFWTRRWSTESG